MGILHEDHPLLQILGLEHQPKAQASHALISYNYGIVIKLYYIFTQFSGEYPRIGIQFST